MKSTIKTIIAITAIAALAACGNKDEASGPNIEMPAVGQPKPVAQPVIDAPQADEAVKLAVPLDQFKAISTEEEFSAVEAGGNYVAVTKNIHPVSGPGATEFQFAKDLHVDYIPLYKIGGWRLNLDEQSKPFNSVPGDLSRANEVGDVRIYFMVKRVAKGATEVKADIAAIEILDLDGKVIAKKSL